MALDPHPSQATAAHPAASMPTAQEIENREVGADGTFGLIDRVAHTRPGPSAPALVNALARIPAEPFGYPIVFWIGGVLFLVIVFMTWSAYI